MSDVFKMLKDRAGGLGSRLKGRTAGSSASGQPSAPDKTPGSADVARDPGSKPPDDPQTLKSRHDT